MQESQFNLLKTKRFLPLFITQFLGAFNDNLFKNALVILITYVIAERAGMNPQVLVTMAAGVFILPFFLFSATAGQLADKYEKSRLIRIIKLVEIFLMIGAGVGFYLESPYFLLFVLFLMGTQSTFFGPIKYGILPEQLKQDELIAGNGIIESGTFVAILFGTILGGLLILSADGRTMISAMILFVAISGWMASFYIPRTRPADPTLAINLNFISETWNMISHARKNREVFLSILGISWFWLVGATFIAQFSNYANVTLGGNEEVYTLLLTMFSVGIGVGSLFCNKLTKGKVDATYVPLGALGMTLFIVDLYYANGSGIATQADKIGAAVFLQSFASWRIVVDLFLIAFCGGVYIVPLYTILQTKSEASHRARVIASNNVVNALFMVVSAIGASIMLSKDFTVPEVFLAVGIGNGFVAIYICKLLPQALVRTTFRWILLTLFRAEVKGLENIEKAGDKVIIVSNHSSFLDAALFAAFLPNGLTFAVNTQASQHWFFKLFLSMADFFVLDPTNPMSTRSLIKRVKQGGRVVIFPEGRLTITGALMKVYEGPGMIADKSGAMILPICIEGAQYTYFSRLKGKVRLRMFPKIKMTVLEPRQLDIDPEIKGRKRRHLAGEKLYDLLTDTLFTSGDHRKPLFEALLDAKDIHGDSHVIMEDIERSPLTYGQMITRTLVLGRAIARNTVRGENVGVMLPNMCSTIITFFALQATGRIPAMLNFSTGVKNLVSACKTAQLKTVYTSKKFVETGKLEDLISAMTENGVNVIYLEDLKQTISTSDKLLGWLGGKFPRLAYRFTHPNKNADDPAVVLFTSGSEGTPKGVVLTHANILANCHQLIARLDLRTQDIVFSALPVFHSFGLTGGTLLPILTGIRTFFYPSPLHYRTVPELAYDTCATLMFGTDTFLAGYAKHAHAYDFFNLRFVFAGAEKLKDSTRKVWAEKFGVRILEGYGTTETGPALAINTPMQNKPGSVGRLLPGIQHRLDPVPGIESGGRLVVSGPNIMAGYLFEDQPGKLNPPENGWYDTGDIVEIDDKGFITIKGRAKRFAKIAGEMVSLTAVEEYLSHLWPEHPSAVVSIPDEKKGEQLILVTCKPEAERQEVIKYAKSKGLGDLSIPKKIIIVDKLPLLGTGKTDYPGIMDLIKDKLEISPIQ